MDDGVKRKIKITLMIIGLLFLAGAGITGREIWLYSKLKVSPEKTIMVVGDKQKLKVNSSRAKQWKSNNKKVAIVSDTGEVTAIKEGKAKITATCMDKELTSTITVEDPKLNTVDMVILPGETQQLEVEGTSQKVKWESENSIVKVKNGIVSADSPGETYVNAIIGEKKLSCHVFVPTPTIKEEYKVKREKQIVIPILNMPKDVTAGWTVENPDIAEIAKQEADNIKITGKNCGVTKVFATVGTEQYETTLKVTGKQNIEIEGEDSVYAGNNIKLTLKDSISSYNVTWENAEGQEDGSAIFTGSERGTTTVKATVDTGTKTFEATKDIQVLARSLNMTEWTGKKGDTFQLILQDGDKVQYTFDRTYLTYSNKTFTALQPGTTTITVVDGDFSGVCNVTITE